MFFANVVRSKLASLLRPWLELEEEPVIEVKLGFLRSIITFKNLCLNPSSLTPLIEKSMGLEFRGVKIGELSVRISPWSFPSLILEVRSVDVTLAPRESVVERRASARDKRKEAIAALDPEGVSLHENLERILFKSCSGNWITMSLVNVILRCCQILFKDIYVQLQLISESHTCMLKVDDISVEPQFVYQCSLFRSLAGLLVISWEETVLAISCSCMEFGQKENDHANWITSLMGLSASVRLNNLQPVDYDFQLPHLNVKISPAIIPLLLVLLDVLHFEEVECSRSGKELWKIAAQRTLSSKLALFNIVNLVLQWSHYVHAYESLLLLIGYYAKDTLAENLAKVSIDRKLLSLVKHQLNLVYEFEERLPAEAVACGRRIARQRISSIHSSFPDLESVSGFLTATLLKIFALFWLLWKIIRFILLSVVQFSFLRNVSSAYQEISNNLSLFGGVSSDLLFELQFSLSLGEVHITVSHSGKKETGVKPELDTSVCFIIRGFCLDYMEDISTTSFLVVLGEVKLCLSSISTVSRTTRDMMIDESDIIMWSNPVLRYYHSEDQHYHSEDADPDPSKVVDSMLDFTQKISMSNLWSNWKKIRKKHEGINIMHHEQPFVLCEVKKNIMDPYISIGGYGLWKCSLLVGKLNLNIEYSSILSIALLVKQMYHYYQWATSVGRTQTLTVGNSQARRQDTLELCTSSLKVAMLNIIPESNIQVGAFITGPRIQLSMQNHRLDGIEQNFGPNVAQGNNCHYCFSLDVENIELAAWPASKAYFSQLSGESISYEGVEDYLWLKEPRSVDIPKPHTNKKNFYLGRTALNASLRLNGLTVTFDDSEANWKSRIFEPLTITLDFSVCRDYVHSLSATTNILSLATSGSVSGAAVLFFVDELWIFLQILEGIRVSSAFNTLENFSLDYSQDFIRRLMTAGRKGTVSNLTKSETAVETMIVEDTQILAKASLELGAMSIILNDSRRKLSTVASMNSDEGSSSAKTYIKSPESKKSKILEMLDLPDSSIGLFIRRSCTQISWEGNHLNVLIEFSSVQSVIFGCQGVSEVCTDTFQIINLLEQSSDYSYRFILSKFIISIYFGSNGVTLSSSTSSNNIDCSDSNGGGNSTIHTEESMPHNHDSNSSLGRYHIFTTRTLEVASGSWLLLDIQLSDISVSGYYMNRLARCQPHKQKISISLINEHHRITCNVQIGYIFLDSSALAMFTHCFQAYFILISNHPLLLNKSRELLGKSQMFMGGQNNFSSGETSDNVVGSVPLVTSFETENTLIKKWFHQDFTVTLSQFSITLAGNIGSEGEIQELSAEADMTIKLLGSERKLVFDLNRLTIFAQYQQRCIQYQSNDQLVPHFRSETLVALPFPIISGNSNFASESAESKTARFGDILSAVNLASPGVNPVKNGAPDCSNHVSYILKHMSASIMIEKMISRNEVGFVLLKTDWVGDGIISGFDMEMTIYEIQMISSLLEPLSGIFGGKGSQDVKQSFVSRTRTQEWNTNEDHSIPDGAIVAIKDLQEHMYVAVEAIDHKYYVVGVPHYSLVSHRALFKVKYHKVWWSQVPLISLISLFAKNNRDESLRLNFSPGSGFVDISSCDDKRQALWQTFPYKPKGFEEDDDVKSCSTSARKAFHLVNQKNNCAIAFVDGLPEFVKKPGNPFKVKVFNEFYLTNDGKLSVTLDTNAQEGSSQVVGEVSEFGVKFPRLNIRIDKVTLTIFDEISDTDAKIPIIRGSINDIDIIGQIMSAKFRIISSFNIAIQYMDAQRDLWRDIVSPVGSSLFFHSRLTNLDTSHIYQGVPAHFFFNMRQVDMSLTEISLDVLLYLVGKLNIAGPFSVRTSTIFPNFCKLENHTGVSLLCNFPGNLDVELAGKQSTSIFLRIAPVDQLLGRESWVSVSLSKPGLFNTLPITVSMSNGCYFAWRTRVRSLQDSRSFPGPFIVVEVSQNVEEGLCLHMSPLLRICNESGFSMELQFRRPQDSEEDCATILLRNGDTLDDSMVAFEALELSGGSKKALMSLTLGNFLLSIRPEIDENIQKNGESISLEWSAYLQGGKAVRISGIFDKLNYRFRKAFGVESVTSFFTSLCCPLTVDGQHITDLHFLVQTNRRDVPLMQPQNIESASEIATSPIAMQVQKEILIYPTVQVYNLLQSDILVHLTENHPDLCTTQTKYFNYIGKKATIPCGSTASFYANPAAMYFMVSLTAYNSWCKPVCSTDWVKKTHKNRSEVHYIDTELDFGGGKYFALLRLSRADKGFLEVTIATSYMLQNNTELPLLFLASNQKPLPLEEVRKYGSDLPPEYGCFLPPKSTRSWFLRSHKVHIKLLEENASVTLLDLDNLSGITELCLEAQDDIGYARMLKLGVSIQPYVQKSRVHMVCFVPRYVIANESKECIFVRQCYLQDQLGEITSVESNQKLALEIRNTGKRRDTSMLDSILKKHQFLNENSLVFIQFRPKDPGFSWSGSVCVASLGRFFLKFKRPPSLADPNSPSCKEKKKSTQFALLEVVEEISSLVLHCYMPLPTNVSLPYRIENCLRLSSLLYNQKDSEEADMLGAGESVEYVWDDYSLPHKLVVQVIDLNLVREINIDKMCSWKPFFKMRQYKGMVLDLPLGKGFSNGKITEEAHRLDVFKVGYEVYADGPMRVLRICESVDCYKEVKVLQPGLGFQFRVSSFAIHLLEKENIRDADRSGLPTFSTVIVVRLSNIGLHSLSTNRFYYYYLRVQSLNIDEKWQGAPFTSMLRRSELHDSSSDESILHMIFIFRSTNSNVKEVKYSSIILQPINLKIDEETLMRLVPFWRTSLSTSRSRSQQFYFKHFEIHPIKITASFLPDNPYSSYSSAQETLRSLLHSVVKVPAVNNKVIELNGILLTHAFVTFRELLIKCAQHYSWYIVRAVYIAKGSPLLPPAFASIFDDTASSSLDVFFDPSDGSVSLPGLTLGMFKLISKCIDSKGSFGTKRYFGDLGKTIRIAGSNALFAALTEISDNILKGAEASGFNGMVTGFHHGILRLAMEPSLLGAAILEGGPDRKIKLDRSPGVDELYIEGYLQAMLDVMYKQEYLRVRVVDNQVVLKNLPPNSSIINEIVENVKSFLVSKALLKGDASTASRPLRHLRTESEWRLGPTVLTLCEHLFVSFTIRILRKQANRFSFGIRWKQNNKDEVASSERRQEKSNRKWVFGNFVFSGLIAYLDGRLCRHIPNPIARRIVSGFLLSYLDNKDGE